MDAKEQIKNRVSITEVAQLYVDLKQAGKYLKALCPFHTEKTPSFFVMPEKGSFSCYGCNKFGDIFTLVQEMENLSFPEAMSFLIDKFHVPVEKSNYKPTIKQDDYHRLNEIALAYFISNLNDGREGKEARQYLQKRGITREIVEEFKLGYARNDWTGLYDHLQKKHCDINRAFDLGLLARGKNGKIYDKFRGRIIFPIFSESGKLIAFGGRTIFDEPNKYINSADTPIYKKGNHLYGFHLAKPAMRESKAVVLVEGYLDVVALYQHGVQNTAASLGTALTENQIYLLKRFAEKIYIFYDNDKAGIAAAVRGIEKMFEQDVNPGIVTFEEPLDPDDFIRQKGVEAFKRELDNAVDGFKFLLHKLDRDFPDWRQVPERKKTAVERIKISLQKIQDPIVRNGYVGLAADYFAIPTAYFAKPAARPNQTVPSRAPRGISLTLAERIFLESIMALPEAVEEFKPQITRPFLTALASGNIIRQIFKHFDPERGAIDIDKATPAMSEAEQAEFRTIFEAGQDVTRPKEALWERLQGSFAKLRDIHQKKDIARINGEIKAAERENDLVRVKELTTLKYKSMKAKYNKLQEA